MKDLPVAPKQFRREIEGLRVLCIVLIMTYHIWVGKVSGGIDIFLVLTGYFAMVSLQQQIERQRTFSIHQIILRSITSLWPPALAVAMMTVVLMYMFYPMSQWSTVLQHMLASVLYVENWHLIKEATNYLAFDGSASPFQHYWSIAIQFQYTLIMPFIVGIVLYVSHLGRWPFRKVLTVILTVAMAISFAYATYLVGVKPEEAYFHFGARIWELLVGAIAAMLVPVIRLTKEASSVFSWIGIWLVIATGVLVPETWLFPSAGALMPVFGALLFILGSHRHTSVIKSVFSSDILVWLSQYVYGMFLIHWPLLITYQLLWETTDVPIIHGIIIMLISFLLSMLLRFVISEGFVNWIKTLSTRALYATLIFLLSVTVCTNVAFSQYVEHVKEGEKEIVDALEEIVIEEVEEEVAPTPVYADYPGAQALTHEHIFANEGVPLIPSLLHVRSDVPSISKDQTCNSKTGKVVKCTFGSTAPDAQSIALIGGSHSGHWFPALEALAEELNFSITTYIHDGCRFTNDDFDGQMTKACLDWNGNVIADLKSSTPSLVFTTATLNKHPQIPDGYLAQWRALEGVTTIFAVTDNPRMAMDIPTCLDRNRDNVAACHMAKEDVLPADLPWHTTPNIPDNVIFTNMSDAFCDETTCYSVAGNMILYRDDNHITATYARTIAPYLRAPLEEALKQVKKVSTQEIPA